MLVVFPKRTYKSKNLAKTSPNIIGKRDDVMTAKPSLRGGGRGAEWALAPSPLIWGIRKKNRKINIIFLTFPACF